MAEQKSLEEYGQILDKIEKLPPMELSIDPILAIILVIRIRSSFLAMPPWRDDPDGCEKFIADIENYLLRQVPGARVLLERTFPEDKEDAPEDLSGKRLEFTDLDESRQNLIMELQLALSTAIKALSSISGQPTSLIRKSLSDSGRLCLHQLREEDIAQCLQAMEGQIYTESLSSLDSPPLNFD